MIGGGGAVRRLGFLLWWAAISLRLDAGPVDFEKEIAPIFERRCLECHGPEKQKGQFRVDRLASLLSGGDLGEPAVVPGKPEESFLLKAVRHEEPDYEMPPRGKALSLAEIGAIERWITEGAATPARLGPATETPELTHWSFLPVEKPEDPAGVDGFVGRKLGEMRLRPSPPADPRTLIRRLFLVMTGLPPSPEKVESFANDEDPDAWERLVEEVLASPHYGERWATHWLDLVRFGETHGFETNRERIHAWRYRDWVIDAFNRDKPYDEFIREQIAGDAVGVDVGTGFLVAGPFDLVKGKDPKLRMMQRMNELDDMINTTGTAFLGLTTGCARCHNHKFDPVTQADYYALQAVFAGVQHGDRKLPLDGEARERIAAIEKEMTLLTGKLKKFLPERDAVVVAVDDGEAEQLCSPRGTADGLTGPEPDLSRGSYTWWENRAGREVLRYRPGVRGKHRIWLSWGAGFSSHSKDARYFLETKVGRREIARIDQQRPADGEGKPDQRKRWSGLYDAGVHDLSPSDTVVLQGGETGSAVTADVVIFQPLGGEAEEEPPAYRAPVNAKRNVEEFPPREARFVRFTIEETNRGEACIDELEIFSGEKNLALAGAGARVVSSGDFVHPRHKLAHLNDGRYGNSHSWIAKGKKSAWVQIELAEVTEIDRIVWGRDRSGEYEDRVPIRYRIEVARTEGDWEAAAGSSDRWPMEGKPEGTGDYRFSGHPEAEAEAEEGRRWLERLEDLREEKAKLGESSLVYAGKFEQPGPTHRLYRGEPEARRERVAPGGIRVLAGFRLPEDAPERERRTALADWIASEDNPLTARVIVNRIWQFHFGTGIVDTPSDLGRNGTAPTHPELLDWLAAELMENGWSLKHIHRLLLHSKTWRQDNKPRASAMKVDAASRYLWRFPPRRLEAEGIRDSILAVTGVLDLEAGGGPGFSAFEVEAENVRHYHPKTDYGPAEWRRMVYMTKVRQEKDVVFGAFDCPDASQAVPKRSRSTTPLQALNLLNSEFLLQQASLFAKRLEREREEPGSRVDRAWQLCFQRPPDRAMREASIDFIEREGLVQFSRALLNSNEFVFIP